MITGLLIAFYRWILDCEPLSEEIKPAFVAFLMIATIFEFAFIIIAFRNRIASWLGWK